MGRIPLSVKLIYAAWMAVWIPVYWVHSGPENFLWLCDVANFLIGLALGALISLGTLGLLGLAVLVERRKRTPRP